MVIHFVCKVQCHLKTEAFQSDFPIGCGVQLNLPTKLPQKLLNENCFGFPSWPIQSHLNTTKWHPQCYWIMNKLCVT